MNKFLCNAPLPSELIELSEYKFIRDVGDITDKLEDLGKNNYKQNNNVNCVCSFLNFLQIHEHLLYY